jgi:ribosomal protein L11 methyltransferase
MANEKRTEWHFVETDVPAPAADAIGSALVDLGSIGVEQRDLDPRTVRLVAYFYEAPDLSELAHGLSAARWVDGEVARAAAANLRAGSTPDDDWLRLWKRGFEPTPVGGRLLVFPSWRREEAEAYTDRVRVEVDPGMAFGTGTHETTQLCLEWLDEFWTGESLLDVGTGTGILAIAALLLKPGAHIVGIDVDPLAVEIARENAVNNGVGGIELRACGPEAVEGEFDVVLANLTADVIISLRDALVARTRPGGHLVLSGILSEQADEVVLELRAAGLEVESLSAAEEWVAIHARRP